MLPEPERYPGRWLHPPQLGHLRQLQGHLARHVAQDYRRHHVHTFARRGGREDQGGHHARHERRLPRVGHPVRRAVQADRPGQPGQRAVGGQQVLLQVDRPLWRHTDGDGAVRRCGQGHSRAGASS